MCGPYELQPTRGLDFHMTLGVRLSKWPLLPSTNYSYRGGIFVKLVE